MVRTAVLGFLLIMASFAGCTGSQAEECPEEGCFPLTSDGLNEILSQRNALDILQIASENQRLRVDTTSTSTVQGQFGEVHWSVSKDDNKEYLHKGIATRNFERSFRLADYVEVESANLSNGLLNIILVRELPEAMKPRKIEISTSKVIEG